MQFIKNFDLEQLDSFISAMFSKPASISYLGLVLFIVLGAWSVVEYRSHLILLEGCIVK